MYKFTNEEIREETDESFRYHAVAYVTGIENGKRSEMKLNYDMKIVKVNNLFSGVRTKTIRTIEKPSEEDRGTLKIFILLTKFFLSNV